MQISLIFLKNRLKTLHDVRIGETVDYFLPEEQDVMIGSKFKKIFYLVVTNVVILT